MKCIYNFNATGFLFFNQLNTFYSVVTSLTRQWSVISLQSYGWRCST